MPAVNAAKKSLRTGDCSTSQHTITSFVNKTGEPIATEGIYTLNNDSKGMFELSSPLITKSKKENQSLLKLNVLVEAVGAATVRFYHRTWTGVHGKVYQDTTQDVDL